MTYLPSLFKKIDTFYRQAMSFTKKAERDYFEELTAIANSVGDPGLARQLRMLAELYRYAISMGGGYATIARAINALKEMYGDEEESDIDSILNGMLAVLAKEAGGAQALGARDNPRFIERLMQLKSDIESRPEENADAYESYQDEVNVSGAEGESEGELGEYGLGGDTETVAPAQLGFGNKEDPKANRGWHTTGPSQPYKNWKEHFANEVNAYSIQLSQTHDPDVARSLQTLIKLIPQLSDLVEAGTELADQIKVAPDEEASKKLAAIRAQIKNLRGQVSGLKKSIRSHQLSNQSNELAAQLEEAVRKNDYKQKELLEQKLALNRLSLSNDVYKTKERNLRLRLIESMSGGNFPGKETLEKEKAKINLAAKERVSKADYDRKLTEERGKQQARLKTPSYEAARGGRRVSMENLSPEERVDFDKAAFAALIKKLRDDNNTAISDARKYIMRPNEKGDPAFKPLVDKISATIRKGDKVAQYAAIEELRNAINNKIKESSLKGYIQSIRLAPHFKNVEERLYALTKAPKGQPEKMDAAGNLINITEEDMQSLSLLLNDIHRLRILYAKYYQSAGSKKTSLQPYAFFKNVILALGKIELYLNTNLHVHRPEKKVLGPRTEYQPIENVDEKKKKLLESSYIHARMTLLSFAEELTNVDQVDPMAADKLAHDIFEKLFNDEMQTIISESAV